VNLTGKFYGIGAKEYVASVRSNKNIAMYSRSKILTLLIGGLALFPLNTVSVNAQSKLTNQSKVFINGIGSVQVGMTVAQASRAAGTRFVSEGYDSNPQCYYIEPQGSPKDVAFMVSNGRIARVDIFKGSISTAKGAKIGDTEARIKSLYPGQIRVSKHKYTNGHYLTFVPRDASDKNYRLVFETDGKRVTQFRSGKLPEVEFIEGCS